MNPYDHQHISIAPFTARMRWLILCLLIPASMLALASRHADAQAEKMFALREATEGVAYTVPLAPPLTGADTYNSSVVEGTLPPGLAITPAGKLEGIPTTPRATPYQFRVRLDASSGGSRTMLLSLEVRQFIPTGSRLIDAPTPTPIPPPPPPPTPIPTPFITTSTSDEESIALTETYPGPAPSPSFNTDIDNVPQILSIISSTIGTSTDDFLVGDYCAVHLIKWKPLKENKSEPDREIWALFKAEAGANGNVKWVEQPDPKNAALFATRIFGRKRVAVLLVHLNTPPEWDVKYKVSVNQKIPTPIQHVIDLAAAISPTGGGREDKAALPKDIWGARLMLTKYESSEIVVKLNAVTAGRDGRPVEQSKEHTNTFVNEGRYHWDVSVGLPVKSVRELQFKSDGNRVFAEAKEKHSVYGFLNLYPKAVDLKSDDFFTFPHIVLGVPLASKPLHHPFAGVGTGLHKMPIKFNIFAGIVFNRERVPRTLGEGSAATTGQLEADLRTRWVRKFMFGINLPVSQIKDAIKK